MKKRILGILLAACMLMSFLPITALAADATSAATLQTALGGPTYASIDGNTVKLLQNVITETIDVKSGTIILDLNGNTITGQSGWRNKIDYYVDSFGKAPIKVSGGTLTIRDSGTGGKLLGGNGCDDTGGIFAYAGIGGSGLEIAGGTVNILGGTLQGGKGADSAYYNGGYGGSGIYYTGGTVSLSGGTFLRGANGTGGTPQDSSYAIVCQTTPVTDISTLIATGCVARNNATPPAEIASGDLAAATYISIVLIHTHADTWSKDKEGHWHECSCGEKVDYSVHTPTTVNVREATVLEKGYTGDTVCSICGYVITKGEDIPVKVKAEKTSPQTGDTGNILVWAVVMFVSGISLFFIVTGKKSKEIQEN